MNELKKQKPEIFEEIEIKFKKGNLDFIKFCLEKYPINNFSVNNVEEKFNQNPSNYLRKMIAKYHPDRLEKNTKEEKEKYLIINEIVKKFNNIYWEYGC